VREEYHSVTRCQAQTASSRRMLQAIYSRESPSISPGITSLAIRSKN